MTAGAYPGFCSINRLDFRRFLESGLVSRTAAGYRAYSMKRLGLDASPSQVTPQHFAGTHLYSCVERGTVRVKCLAQEHNKMTRPGLEPGPLDPESSALTTRPPRLP